MEIFHGADRIAQDDRAARHRVVTHAEHHHGIPLGSQSRGDKILVRLRETAPVVEARPLAAYDAVAIGGSR